MGSQGTILKLVAPGLNHGSGAEALRFASAARSGSACATRGCRTLMHF